MNVLAASAGESAFWFIAIGLVVVVVVGMIAVVVALFSIMRSISASLGHLREVVGVQTEQGHAAEPGGPGTDAPADGAPGAGAGETKNGGRDGTTKE